MADALGVGLTKGAADPPDDRHDVGGAHTPPAQPVSQGLPRDHGHDNVDVVVVIVPTGVQDTHRVGVGEPLKSPDLTLRPAGPIRIPLEVHHLDRDLTPHKEVMTEPHRRLAARAHPTLKTITPADQCSSPHH